MAGIKQSFCRGLAALPFVTVAVQAGPNLMAIGSYGDVPFKRAEGRISHSGREVVYSFDDPKFDFGRVVVRSTQPLSVIKRDLFVGFDGNGLRIDTGAGGSNVQLQELEIWLKIQGRIRPGFSYEWEIEVGAAQEVEAFPAVIPLLWADGEPLASEVTVATPEPEDADRIQRLLLPHGVVKIKEFSQQTGAAWVVLKPRNFGNFIVITRFSFREVDRDPKPDAQSTMPAPVRYIEIRSELEDQIAGALERAGENLIRAQKSEGFWEGADLAGSVRLTAGSILALWERYPDDERLKKAMDWLAKQSPATGESWDNLTVALRLFALSRYGSLSSFGPVIQKDVLTLTDAQNDDGGWGERSRADATSAALAVSNHARSLFTLLALREARFAGAEPEKSVWRKALQYWTDGQIYDGGYNQKLPRHGGVGSPATPVFTAMGAAGLMAALDMNSSFGTKRCNTYLAAAEQLRATNKALEWLDKNFAKDISFVRDPDEELDPTIQSNGMLSLSVVGGISKLNKKLVFEETAKKCLQHYDPAAGLFGVRGPNNTFTEQPSIARTAEALGFLAQGAAPTICQRIIAGDDEKNHQQFRSDVAHLVRHIAAKRGRYFNWRRASIEDEVPELIRVPITVLSFVGAANWTEAHWGKIREYCLAGGTIVVDISDDGQRAAVQAAIAKTFPEYPMADVPSDAAVFSAEKDTRPIAGLKSLSNGFRHFLFLPPESWSCAWHMNQPTETKDSFAFMNSLLTYATDGTPPRSSFAASTYPVASSPSRSMRACRLQVGGTVPAYPNLLATMDRLMQANFRTGVVEVAEPKDADLVWINIAGDAADDQMKSKIKQAVSSGVFLFADVIGGKKEWDSSFRLLLQEIDPAIRLQRLRRTDSVYTGEIPGTQGIDVVQVHFRKALQSRFSTSGRCDLWAILKDGKPIGIFSGHDLSSGIGYHYFPGCRGVMPGDARSVCMNVFLQAYGRKVMGKPQA